MSVSDQIVVLDVGRVVAGAAADVDDPSVLRDVYSGRHPGGRPR